MSACSSPSATYRRPSSRPPGEKRSKTGRSVPLRAPHSRRVAPTTRAVGRSARAYSPPSVHNGKASIKPGAIHLRDPSVPRGSLRVTNRPAACCIVLGAPPPDLQRSECSSCCRLRITPDPHWYRWSQYLRLCSSAPWWLFYRTVTVRYAELPPDDAVPDNVTERFVSVEPAVNVYVLALLELFMFAEAVALPYSDAPKPGNTCMPLLLPENAASLHSDGDDCRRRRVPGDIGGDHSEVVAARCQGSRIPADGVRRTGICTDRRPGVGTVHGVLELCRGDTRECIRRVGRDRDRTP